MREPGPGEHTLVIRTARDGVAAVGISIQDSGSGFDETDNDRMFQPLYTTKTEGLGMGLAIARTIVGAHGGRLSAANNADRGATFHFTLPVREERAP
jgi:signal transduction histidine kinase